MVAALVAGVAVAAVVDSFAVGGRAAGRIRCDIALAAVVQAMGEDCNL